MSPLSRTSRPLARSASARPAARNAAGPSSWPGANAPALVGAPISATGRVAESPGSPHGEPVGATGRVTESPGSPLASGSRYRRARPPGEGLPDRLSEGALAGLGHGGGCVLRVDHHPGLA